MFRLDQENDPIYVIEWISELFKLFLQNNRYKCIFPYTFYDRYFNFFAKSFRFKVSGI